MYVYERQVRCACSAFPAVYHNPCMFYVVGPVALASVSIVVRLLEQYRRFPGVSINRVELGVGSSPKSECVRRFEFVGTLTSCIDVFYEPRINGTSYIPPDTSSPWSLTYTQSRSREMATCFAGNTTQLGGGLAGEHSTRLQSFRIFLYIKE